MAVKEYSYKNNGNDKLSDHFRVKEFRARRGTKIDGDKILVSEELIEMLEKLSRAVRHRAVIVTDGYRTEEYDKLLTGKVGQHTKGLAADVWVDGFTSYELAAIAEILGFDGIGVINKRAVHLDVRGYKSFFVENSTLATDTYSVKTFLCTETYMNLVKKLFVLNDNTIEYMKKWKWYDLLFEKLVEGAIRG
ncbi:MAG: hypothetical protein E7582_03155 [Ruminococcaceae bacterium]|nr:hypothetical protein [Oscillospiraceae bacterium]